MIRELNKSMYDSLLLFITLICKLYMLFICRFGRDHFPLSINMNPVHLEQLSQALWQEKKKYHVVVGIRGESGPQVRIIIL